MDGDPTTPYRQGSTRGRRLRRAVLERVWQGFSSDGEGRMARTTVEQPTRTVPTGPLEIRVLGPLHTTLDGEQLRLGTRRRTAS